MLDAALTDTVQKFPVHIQVSGLCARLEQVHFGTSAFGVWLGGYEGRLQRQCGCFGELRFARSEVGRTRQSVISWAPVHSRARAACAFSLFAEVPPGYGLDRMATFLLRPPRKFCGCLTRAAHLALLGVPLVHFFATSFQNLSVLMKYLRRFSYSCLSLTVTTRAAVQFMSDQRRRS
jgi:hypothetical protein